MRTSSPSQLEFGYSDTERISESGPAASRLGVLDLLGTENLSSSYAESRIVEFAAPEIYAATSRIAGRINASSVSEQEHQALLQERQFLLDKKFDGTITRREANKLEYIRWSLDRIEDAKHGAILDELEDSVKIYERFASDLHKLEGQLLQHLNKKRK